jgi:hypothetical protein
MSTPSFEELQKVAIDIEIAIKERMNWVRTEHKEVVGGGEDAFVFLRLDFGDSSFRDTDLDWMKRLAKRYNLRLKALAFKNGDHLSVDLHFYPKKRSEGLL